MFQPARISPSILSADFMNMGADVVRIASGGADWVHVDVMDGHFVPNITMGVPLVSQLDAAIDLPLDVHLMISNPLRQIPWFLDAGADIVTFHAEAADEKQTADAIALIHEAGAKAGLAIKPATPTDVVRPFIAEVDMVLVMSVEPGFSGQSFMDGSDAKVAEVVEMSREVGVAPLIQVDGGIGEATIGCVAKAGADVFVCGNAVFATDNPARAIADIRQAALDAVSAEMDAR